MRDSMPAREGGGDSGAARFLHLSIQYEHLCTPGDRLKRRAALIDFRVFRAPGAGKADRQASRSRLCGVARPGHQCHGRTAAKAAGHRG